MMIASAATPRFSFGDYYTILTRDNNISSLNLIWVGSGFVLMAVGIFGLYSAFKETTMSLYTIILAFVLILQIVTATTANTLSGQLDHFVSKSVRHLMTQYGYDSELTSIMDNIQKEYKCCGNESPKDWYLLDQFSTTRKTATRSTTIAPAVHNSRSILPETMDKSSNNELSLPTSCCKNKCKSYHSSGCLKKLYNEMMRVVLMVRLSAMISTVLQIFGILAAYIFGRNIRDQKCNRMNRIVQR